MSASEALCRLVARPSSPVARRHEPLTFGVPLPRGRVHDASRLVAVSGDPRPTEARVVERWPDGSIRWALVDTRIDLPPDGAEIHVRDDVAAPAIEQPLTLALSPRQASVASGDVRLELDLDRGRPFAGVLVGDRPVIDAPRAVVSLLDAQGQPMAVHYSTIEVEHAGVLRVVLRVTGEAIGGGGARLLVRLRLTALAGLPVLGVELGLHNPRAAAHPGGFWELGDAGLVLLRSAALEFALPGPARACRLSIARAEPLLAMALPLALTQHSSGGEQWASAVHVGRNGNVALDCRGYVLRAGGVETTGLRAAPVLAAEHDGGVLYATSERFWEVFPKAVELGDDAVMRMASLAVGPECHEMQGGERSDHEVWIGWGADGVADLPLEWRRSPARVLPDVRAVAEAEGLPALEPAGGDTSSPYEALIAAAVDGDDAFIAKRERIDEYGWRHFGDLYADHENGVPDRPAPHRLALQQSVRRGRTASRCSACATAIRAGGG